MRHALAAALIALPLVAQAQDRPHTFPTRDVAVTYSVTGQGRQGEVTIIWSAVSRMMRVNLPGNAGFTVADEQNQRAFLVIEAARAVVDVPVAEAGGFTTAFNNYSFTRGDTARIAGTDCTAWRLEGRSDSGEACFTADGVMLRLEGTTALVRQVQVEAVRVEYGPQDPALFRRPEGYQAMQAPQRTPGAPATPR